MNKTESIAAGCKMSKENQNESKFDKPKGFDPFNDIPEGAMQDESQVIELTERCEKCGQDYPKDFMCFDYCYNCADKLELKHIVGYLPYELKIQGQTHGQIETIVCCTDTSVYIQTDSFKLIAWADLFEVKPILRPLSDYSNLNSKSMCDLDIDLCDQMELQDYADSLMALQSVSFGVIEIMQKNHIDMYRLIDKGLAISYDDINKI
jgi:hypothetical protein